jgi:hypothetical protein
VKLAGRGSVPAIVSSALNTPSPSVSNDVIRSKQPWAVKGEGELTQQAESLSGNRREEREREYGRYWEA